MAEPIFVGGAWTAPGSALPVRSPWDGRIVSEVGLAGPREGEAALRALVEGAGRSRALARADRFRILRGIADGVAAAREALARRISEEAGKPIALAEGEVDRAAHTFSLAADEARRLGGEVLPLDHDPRARGVEGIARRFPVGGVVGIVPFNFPLNLAAHKVGPALAAGCSILLKPAPQAPGAALLLGRIAEAAGAPPGSVQVVPCEDSISEGFVRDGRPAMLSFTGSSRVGWRLRSIAGRKRVLLECGGNAAVVVAADADVAAAAARSAFGAYAYAGQVCISVQRIYAERPVHGQFLRAFADAAAGLPAGDPSDRATVVGPMISREAADRAEAWVAEAEALGARNLLAPLSREGNVVRPVLLENVPRSARLACEEAFGPVAIVEAVDSFEEGLARANDARFGLQAGVFTRDLGRAFAAFEGLDVGAVVVNDAPIFRVDSYPYGGIRESGLGREGVRYAVEAMTEWKVMVVRTG